MTDAAETDVVVVGGGITGCGVARDLAMRGLEVALVERESLNAGTTGRSHGVLHSGARYADEDPESAADCRRENHVVRRIAGACVEETGGYVVALEADDESYFERTLEACRDCGIDAEVVDGPTVREAEPALSPETDRAIAVPDAVVYPSRLTAATAASAREHGARLETGATVQDLAPSGEGVAVSYDDATGDAVTLHARHVVNAAGAWAGAVAGLAGVDLSMAPTRGVMVALAEPGVGAVLNRCRPPDDGDIVVPHPETAVCGTTSVPVSDPDRPDGTDAEAAAVRAACADLVPALAEAAERRRFWGVRPLRRPGGRSAGRGFDLVDHAERDGVAGLTTIVGGKLTTYRLMAEAVGDLVAGRLGVSAASGTAGEPLPGHDDPERLDDLVASLSTTGPADEDVVPG